MSFLASVLPQLPHHPPFPYRLVLDQTPLLTASPRLASQLPCYWLMLSQLRRHLESFSLLCEHNKLFSNLEASGVFPTGKCTQPLTYTAPCAPPRYPHTPEDFSNLILLIHVLSPFPISTCFVPIVHFDTVSRFHTGIEERVKVLTGHCLLLLYFSQLVPG